MDFFDYREKLGIGFNDQEKVKHFMVKMFNVLDYLIKQGRTEFIIRPIEYYTFCDITGTKHRSPSYGETCYDAVVDVLGCKKNTLEEFLVYYLAFVNCVGENNDADFNKEFFKNAVCKNLKESHIPFDLIKDDDGYFIFPKGAKEPDYALVSEPLEWLKEYPVSHKAFTKALKAYASVTDDNVSDVADLFRKALESFFQEFFVSDKSLEKLKSEYGSFLSKKGVPGEIKNNFEKLLEAYTKYNNNYAKHHDKASLNVLEYIMYQTGSLIRLIITLNKEDDVNAD